MNNGGFLMSFDFTSKNLKIFILSVYKEHIINGQLQFYLDQLDVFEIQKSGNRNAICITFEGFDEDPRDIYDIPKIRTWFYQLYEKKPYLFYFLSNFDGFYLLNMYRTLLPLKSKGDPKLLNKIIKDSLDISKEFKDSNQTQYEVVKRLMDVLALNLPSL